MKYVFYIIFSLTYFMSSAQNDSILIIGDHLINENKLNGAITHYNRFLVKALHSKNNENQIYAYLGLAEAYKLKLDYDTALENYTLAYKAIKNNDNKQLEFLYHVKMGEFYRKRTLFLNAIKELNMADRILKNNKIKDLYLAKYYNRKAALFTEYYNINDSTIFYANKSLKLAKKIDDKDNIFYSTLEIASVYERLNAYDKSIVYFEELIAYAKVNRLIQHQADAYISYTSLLIKMKSYQKALNQSLIALKFSEENNLLYNENIFTINVYECYNALGNSKKAFEYLEHRLALTERYYKQEHNQFLFELEEKYKLTEKENQIIINNLELDNKNKELASSEVKLYISGVLFLTTILIALFIAYFLRVSKENNKKLQALSKDNEFLLSEANHRINNNLQLVIILISNQLKKASEKEQFQLKNILTKVEAISTLHRHLYKNEDKKEVEIKKYLNDVKISFFDVFKENEITTHFKMVSVKLPTDYAMYIGLLLTELCINSIKHAFTKQENRQINFELSYKESILYFNYSDNGTVSISKDIKPKLIDKICRQLEIKYTIKTRNGFSFSFEKELIND
ncbi:tetratricopeptide repeat-containing sensor histidine kinase [Lacinutrix undariae]